MGLMLVLLISLLAVTAAVVAAAAARNGLVSSEQSGNEVTGCIAKQRRHLAEATRVRPYRVLR